jgi:hypothetical protein
LHQCAGPQYPLYLLGHKMLRWYPYVPVGGEMALNCAILTYDGTAYFGFSGDVHAAPDLRRLEAFLKLSFEELREAAGIKPPDKERRKYGKRRKRSNREERKYGRGRGIATRAPAGGNSSCNHPAHSPSPARQVEPPPTTDEERVLTQMIA